MSLISILGNIGETSSDYERVTLPNGDEILRRVTPVPQKNHNKEESKPRIIYYDKNGNLQSKEVDSL